MAAWRNKIHIDLGRRPRGCVVLTILLVITVNAAF